VTVCQLYSSLLAVKKEGLDRLLRVWIMSKLQRNLRRVMYPFSSAVSVLGFQNIDGFGGRGSLSRSRVYWRHCACWRRWPDFDSATPAVDRFLDVTVGHLHGANMIFMSPSR
jgi:hypothetical protein